MSGAKTDERNYYAESYIALIEAIIKETASIIKDIKAIALLNGNRQRDFQGILFLLTGRFTVSTMTKS